MVAAEDKHFYSEGGVSPTGIIRAAMADLTSGSVQQGGSTITQQLVRNYYDGIGTAQTVSRKIKEIFVAEKLASEKSKLWILTNYMNTVPTGPNMYGFGAAAESYFGVPVSKLTVAQAAMIASPIAPAKVSLPAKTVLDAANENDENIATRTRESLFIFSLLLVCVSCTLFLFPHILRNHVVITSEFRQQILKSNHQIQMSHFKFSSDNVDAALRSEMSDLE